jgi:class 3 adenylate cyclase
MKNPFDFRGKVALVTGAASGMGLATAQAFAEAGAAVVLADFREDLVKSEAQKIASAGHKAVGIRCDVSDDGQVEQMVDIRGFTPLSRQMRSEDLDALLGAWILTCKEIIENQRGIINKYLGDGFLAYWPETSTNPEEIVAAISALKELQRRESPAFRLVMHFGPVAVGGVASMGEESLMGGEVNLIFRMEKLASSLGEPCCFSETANAKLRGLIATRSLGEFELKGFEAKCVFFAL